ncbi:uncharacterized protein [Henckelia pumila]|uniref:uncharacterized protein isoform X2 n=1 Tax=Henckelia pumila TaxID=405737 RepID=UPI003C6E977A
MEYTDEDNGVAGRIPECGAIFMANAVTKKECFRHNVFALPSSMAGFLKHVKAGMVLFMFEYEKRELFGVYEAVSDGAMDIVPHAFHRVGKHFPAQVIFRHIWNCYPLLEKEFRDAIRENYFSAKKFNFGLSEDQVHRLLLLFSAKKLKNKLPACLETELVSQSDGKDKHLVGDDMFLLNKETYMEPKDRVHKDDKINCDDQGILIDYPDEFFTKRRRLDNDGRLVLNKVTENALYNSRSPLRFTCIDSQKDSLNEEGRLGDNCRGLPVDWVSIENQVGKNFNPVLSAEYVLHPSDIRMTDGGILMHRNRMFRESNKDISFGEAFETECFGKPINRSRLPTDNDRFLIDDDMQTEYMASNDVRQSDQDLLVQARKVTNDHKCYTNVNFESRYHVHHAGSLSASANPCNLHTVRKTIAVGNERIESEPNFGTFSRAGSENFANPLHYDLRTIHNGEISIIDRKATESTLSPAALKNSRYIANCGGRVVVDDDRFRKSNEVENLEEIDKYVSPVISAEHPSLVRVPQSHDPSCSNFDHGTKAHPYVSKDPFVDQGCSSSWEADRNTILVREDLPYHGSLDPCHSLYTKSSLAYFSESKTSSRYLDIARECENKVSATITSSCQSSVFHDTTNSCLNSKSSMGEDLDTPASVGFRGSFSKHSISSVPQTDGESIGVRKRLPLVYKSNGQQYGLGGNISNGSHHMSGHVPYTTLDMLTQNKSLLPKENCFGEHAYRGESDLRSDVGHFSKMSCNLKHSEAPHLSPNIRKSVFTRLTSGQYIQFDEERNGVPFNCPDRYMDASADEVMEMLHKGKNRPCSKLKNIRMVGQNNNGETSLDGKRMESHLNVNQSIDEKKILKDAHLATVEGSNKVPKETRIIDFKRRSETNKILVGTGTTSVVIKNIIDDSGEAERSAKKIFKRKRLVRPVFMENELAVDNLVSQKNTYFPGQCLDKDDEQHFVSAICTGEDQIINDDSRSNIVLSLDIQQSMDDSTKENTSHLVQNGPRDNILSSTHHGPKRHASLSIEFENGSSQVAGKDASQQRISCIQTPKIIVPSRDGDTVSSLNLPKASADRV